jgi:hypothetical protein
MFEMRTTFGSTNFSGMVHMGLSFSSDGTRTPGDRQAVPKGSRS